MIKPKKWTEVYPYGTKAGDEEAKFFKTLARNPKYQYRSVKAIAKDSGLTVDRVEELIEKYTKCNPPLIYQHPTTSGNWGYWERCADEHLNVDKRSTSDKDKDNRIDKHRSGACTKTLNDPSFTTIC